MSLRKIELNGIDSLDVADCDAILNEIASVEGPVKLKGSQEAAELISMIAELATTKNNTRKKQIYAMVAGMKVRVLEKKKALGA